jgi:hypothetical protein
MVFGVWYQEKSLRNNTSLVFENNFHKIIFILFSLSLNARNDGFVISFPKPVWFVFQKYQISNAIFFLSTKFENFTSICWPIYFKKNLQSLWTFAPHLDLRKTLREIRTSHVFNFKSLSKPLSGKFWHILFQSKTLLLFNHTSTSHPPL